MPSRRTILLCVLLGVLAVGGLGSYLKSHDATSSAGAGMAAGEGTGGAAIDKQPVNFATRTFDPAAPPSDMPPLGPGEEAECESNFLSNASVSDRSHKTDSTHATVTIAQVKITLQLNITIWVPDGVTEHVMDHEQGHRQISEHYYETADQVASRIAAEYLGKRVEVSGDDLDAQVDKTLQQISVDITNEYAREVNPDPVQHHYDNITDHARNDVPAADGVAQALRDAGDMPGEPESNGAAPSGVPLPNAPDSNQDSGATATPANPGN